MYRPSLRSQTTLIGLGILAITLFYFSMTRYRVIQDETKLKAAKQMSSFMNILKQETTVRGYDIDSTNDPNLTGLIGVKRDSSAITTSYGSISQRLTSLNPNFAAVMVEYLVNAGVENGDYIAVGVTGANPGANLAMYAAIKTLNLRPTIITSVGSAEFGANREDFTWLDMEKVLVNAGAIEFSSKFASLGGNKDRGGGLGRNGRKLIREAILRNGLDPNDLWVGNKDEADFVKKRFTAYKQYLPLNEDYKVFVNIGGGYGNVGKIQNAKEINNGLNEKLFEKEFEDGGVLMEYARTIPIIHIYDSRVIAEQFELPIDPEPIPEIGVGKVFESKTLNVTVAAICLGILLLAIVLVVIFDRQDRHFASNMVDPDNNL